MNRPAAAYEGVAVCAPVTVPYVRFSPESAHWWAANYISVERAVEYAANTHNAVVVHAAGNGDRDVVSNTLAVVRMGAPGGPAFTAKPIVVAASAEDDTRADFSNHGTAVDLGAPGGHCPCSVSR